MRFKALVAAIGLAAVGAVVLRVAADDSSVIQIKDAWIRWLPGSLPAGGYLTLINRTDQPVSLIGASSPDFGGVAMHRSQTRDGMSTMLAVGRIIVAPHSQLEFASLGYHLMLTAPRLALKPGDQVPVSLNFSDGARLTVPFELRRPDGSAVRPLPPTDRDVKVESGK